MKIFTIDQIKQAIDLDNNLEAIIKSQRQSFIDFSAGLYNVPQPIQLSFPQSSGDCHIKAGLKKSSDAFVIKVASGFYNNTKIGLPSGDGAMLIFCQKTGVLQTILCDGGWLTTLRTAIAGLIAASITPWEIRNVGIVGTGSLAVLIKFLLKKRYSDVNLYIWGRDSSKAKDIASEGVHVYESIQELLAKSDTVITTTASSKPIIKGYITGKKHIIALGADDIHKQECAPCLFEQADAVIVDSLSQASKFGDTFHAFAEKFITIEKVIELGDILQKKIQPDAQLIITDLTGIAAQDLAIAEYVSVRLQT